jgi:chitinase
LLACVCPTFATATETPAKTGILVGYFPEWSVYDRNYHPADIPADLLTHVNYAFAKISDVGEVQVFDRFAAMEKNYPGDPTDLPADGHGAFRQLRVLKEKHPHLKSLISIGGWTLSGKFSDIAATAEAREKFAVSAVAFMRRHGFDGIDIDWEYPGGGGLAGNKSRKEDKQNFTLLLESLRGELSLWGKRDGGKHYLLTIAAPGGPQQIARIEPGKFHQHLDWINIMAYDFAGPWSERTAHHAALFPPKDANAEQRALCADAAVKAYLDAGVPAEKLVLGVPFFGHGWAGVPANDANGMNQPHGPKPPTAKFGEGQFDYRELASKPPAGAVRFFDPVAKSPWLFESKTGVVITFEDPESLALKAAYVRDRKLGGVMIWELSADSPDHALLNALAKRGK